MDLQLDGLNLKTDVKSVPVVPAGNFTGNIVKAEHDAEKYCISLFAVLEGNEGFFCSDNETPVDGQQVVLNVWLPKPGDENVLTGSKKQTKRQWKINNMAKVFEKLGLDLATADDISNALANGGFLVEGVQIATKNREYEGEIQTEVKSITI